MYVYVHVYLHTYLHTYIRTYTCMYTYMHTYIHVYSYIATHTAVTIYHMPAAYYSNGEVLWTWRYTQREIAPFYALVEVTL